MLEEVPGKNALNDASLVLVPLLSVWNVLPLIYFWVWRSWGEQDGFERGGLDAGPVPHHPELVPHPSSSASE